MKLVTRFLLVTALLAAFASVASAATRGIDRREARQQLRIAQGARCGQLTRGETRRLRMGQRHIRRMERRARTDGMVTMAERRRLHRGLDRQDRAIARLRHNGRTR